MKSAVDKNTSDFLDGDLSHAEMQRRREGGLPANAILICFSILSLLPVNPIEPM